MHSHETYKLPLNIERAIGCVPDKQPTRRMAVYRNPAGAGVWTSGAAQGYLAPGLLALFESLWGPLAREYAYVLDMEKGVVTVRLRRTLAMILSVRRLAPAAPWLVEEATLQAVVAHLIAYAEAPADDGADGCRDCYGGYVWQEAFYAFVACAWCDGTG
jgi:hypothetical protein